MSYPDLTPEQLQARAAKVARKQRKAIERSASRAPRRGRITQKEERFAPLAKLEKRELGQHVTAPHFHHDPRVKASRSAFALARAKWLSNERRARWAALHPKKAPEAEGSE